MTSVLKKYKTVIVFLVVLLLGFLAYIMFFKDSDTAALLSSTSTSAQDTQAVVLGQQILAMLAELKSIQLDPSVVRTPLFMSLHDFRPPLDPQPVGRRNPFAPLNAGEAGFGITSTSTAAQ